MVVSQIVMYALTILLRDLVITIDEITAGTAMSERFDLPSLIEFHLRYYEETLPNEEGNDKFATFKYERKMQLNID